MLKIAPENLIAFWERQVKSHGKRKLISAALSAAPIADPEQWVPGTVFLFTDLCKPEFDFSRFSLHCYLEQWPRKSVTVNMWNIFAACVEIAVSPHDDCYSKAFHYTPVNWIRTIHHVHAALPLQERQKRILDVGQYAITDGGRPSYNGKKVFRG